MSRLGSQATWMRGLLAVITYWALFILGPLYLFVAWWGWTPLTKAILVPLFFILFLIGEHGFRIWKRLWRVP